MIPRHSYGITGLTKVMVNESLLRQLEAKVRALDAAHAAPSTASPSSRRLPSDDDDEFADGQPLLEPFTHLRLERPSMSFQGPASSDNFLRNVRKLYHEEDDGSISLECWHTDLYDPGALPARTFGLRTRLPPPDTARWLFLAQHVYIGTIFSFTESLEAFEQMLGEAYHGPPDPCDREACLKYAKVLLVLAFGQLYSVNQWVGFRGPPGFDYFADSLGLLPETHEEGSLGGVEALALAGYFMQNMNRQDAAFQYLGRALRMAVSLGLHLEMADDGDEAGRERRRRVWWSVYSLDRILCVKSGNPLTIQDDDIGVSLPTRLPAEAEHGPASVLRDYTQLSRILGQIHDSIYRRSVRRSGRSLVAAVQNIIRALSRWFRELPAALRFEPRNFNRESVGTLAHYYQCINMTVRPLLLHVVERRLRAIRAGGPEEKERDWKAGLSQATVRVVEMGLGAAHDTVNMMAIAAQRDMVATYGYMDGEHIFSASIVLVMACAAFPANAANKMAMQTGLGLLRYMGERGNSHLGSRYELLQTLHVGAGQALSSSTSPPAPPAGSSSSSSYVDARGGLPEAMASFPAVDNSFLDEPLSDETGMDFGLWEEGFASPTMDLDFDLAQRTSTGGGYVNLSDLMYNG
ncbi:fungal specific transcription factor [Ophiocordyceps camponoti-floridani]|uniref:Fungal specific transcription factor n=1 Tax=Ophiocordyceps camponoti-floridani TaxID=2030778 RepID=A0A8H4VD16_9HYPO|nr:fungal specific transcription factor [Ophiocordyceps camponoti-floridani]